MAGQLRKVKDRNMPSWSGLRERPLTLQGRCDYARLRMPYVLQRPIASIRTKAETTARTIGVLHLRPPDRMTGGMYQSGSGAGIWDRYVPMGTASSGSGSSGSAANASSVNSSSVNPSSVNAVSVGNSLAVMRQTYRLAVSRRAPVPHGLWGVLKPSGWSALPENTGQTAGDHEASPDQ